MQEINSSEGYSGDFSQYKQTVGLLYYFLMLPVYMIPVIGFIVCLICCFVGNNASKKNFARAVLIWKVLGVIGLTITCVAGYLIIDSATKYVINQFKERYSIMENLGDLGNLYQQPEQPEEGGGHQSLQDLRDQGLLDGVVEDELSEDADSLEQLEDVLNALQETDGLEENIDLESINELLELLNSLMETQE